MRRLTEHIQFIVTYIFRLEFFCSVMMSLACLECLTLDPINGVVAQHSNFHIMMGREDLGNFREALVKKLNLNMNKCYPDASGILMGYQGIK
jgi:hypothetical protein